MQVIKNILIGIILGVSNVIPGVSAGTMAVILNIYDQLLDSLSLDKLKQNARFLIAIGIGAVVGIIFFSNTIQFLFAEYNMATNFTFIGVILGSIPMIINHAKEEEPIKGTNYIPFIIMLGIMLVMSMDSGEGQAEDVMLKLNAVTGVWLMLSGAISAFTMIIPGISGSFIMLTLGTYSTVIGTIAQFTKTPFNPQVLATLTVVGIGVLIGLGLGIKLVRILLEKYKQATYMAILGLVIGSILVIYPGFTLNATGMISLGMMCIGAAVAYRFSDH